jgi:predicted PhzF superfamily epimerase YddE/YHI9
MTTVDVVRVFCDENGDFGNELGLVRSSATTKGREQAIAAELGFSETVFIDELTDGRATIRIFTPAGELPFAGHPSVGTAWWLASAGTPVTTLVEKAGDVAVRYDGDLTWISGRAEWAPEFTWMPQPTPADVDALDPSAFTEGMNYPWSWIDEEAGVLRSRMFGPEHNIAEDEATGAAAVAVTTHLGRDLDIRQGRGSRILTRRGESGLVHIAGRTVYDRAMTI